jgi:toxin ParE1/3/4
MQATTALLGRHPYHGQATDLDDVRRMIVSPFPYLIFYRVTADAVIIQRVRHTSRDPLAVPGRA